MKREMAETETLREGGIKRMRHDSAGRGACTDTGMGNSRERESEG